MATIAGETLAGGKGDVQVERASVLGSTAFRALAICSYLKDGDLSGFHSNLYRAARCRLHYLVRGIGNTKFDGSILAASYDDPLFDALACQSRKTAELLIAFHRSKYHPSFDDLGRTRYSYFIRKLIVPRLVDDDRYRGLEIEGWLGEPPEDARHAIAVAIQSNDTKSLAKAIGALMDDRRKEAKAGEPIGEGGDRVHIEGLGILWAAREAGLRVDVRDPLLPPELQASRRAKLTLGPLPPLHDREIQRMDEAIARLGGYSLDEAKKRRPDPQELG